MQFFIVAPTLTVHIVDDYYTTDKVKSAVCGLRSYEGINTHAWANLNIKTGATLDACKNCETVYLGRHANVVKNRAA